MPTVFQFEVVSTAPVTKKRKQHSNRLDKKPRWTAGPLDRYQSAETDLLRVGDAARLSEMEAAVERGGVVWSEGQATRVCQRLVRIVEQISKITSAPAGHA